MYLYIPIRHLEDIQEKRVRGEWLLHMDVRGQYAVVQHRHGCCRGSSDWLYTASDLARRSEEGVVVLFGHLHHLHSVLLYCSRSGLSHHVAYGL